MCYLRFGIEAAPLQVYASGLTFCPGIFLESMSKKRNDAQDEVYKWSTSSLNLSRYWSPRIQTFSLSSLEPYMTPIEDGILICSWFRDILIIQRTDNEAPVQLIGHYNDAKLGVYSTDCTRLACLSSDGELAVWDLKQERILKTLDIKTDWFPRSWRYYGGEIALTFTSNGSTLLLACHGCIGMWNLDQDMFSKRCDIRSYSRSITNVFGREGTLLATLEKDTIEIWNLDDNHMIRKYLHLNLVEIGDKRLPMAFSHDGNKFAVSEIDRVTIHDLESDKDLYVDTKAMGLEISADAPIFTRSGNIGARHSSGVLVSAFPPMNHRLQMLQDLVLISGMLSCLRSPIETTTSVISCETTSYPVMDASLQSLQGTR
ncbi:hypothetical protein FSST1_005435 [Fusarium sambucinum]